MLKYVLLATAMTLSAPVLAQEASKPGETPPSAKADPMNHAPLGSASEARTDPTATPPAAAPTAPSTTSAPVSPADQATENKSALETNPRGETAQPTPPSDEPKTTSSNETAQTAPADTSGVSSVVDKEFASYDKDSDGSLSKAEFGAWMDALKAKSANGATAAADPKWNDAAFAQADTDKSAALSKGELTTFLSGATASS